MKTIAAWLVHAIAIFSTKTGLKMTSTTTTSSSSKKQCVYIVRYGLTEYPLVEYEGPFDSDIDPSIGIDHAKCIGKKIATNSSNNHSPVTMIYTSPFLRTCHTAHHIANQCGKVPVRIEEGLYEWLTPSLLVTPDGKRTYPRSVHDTAKLLFPTTIDTKYKSVNPLTETNDNNNGSNNKDDDVVPNTTTTTTTTGAPQFPESEEALLKRSAITLERLLANHEKEKEQLSSSSSIVIVSHAPVDQAMAFWLEGATSTGTSKLKSLPLGGIICFSRESKTHLWQLECYGDTDHMPGDYQHGLKHWSLPCLCEGGDDLKRPKIS